MRFLRFCCIVFLYFIPPFSSNAQLAIIRDAETEKFLRNLCYPIFDAAGLDSSEIAIYIINDESLNAFVTGGKNVFIHSGLISRFSTPDALIGVVAHETGHITAGHLARSSENAQKATGAMLLGYLLGIGAALSGSPDAATAIILGSSQTAERVFMKFTREQEEAADQLGLKYLNKLRYPAKGLVELLEIFQKEMTTSGAQIDEYLLSHPVSIKRIDYLKANTLHSNFSDKNINAKLQKQMNRVLLKLEAYMEKPADLLKKYQNSNDDEANYVKAIALHRSAHSKEGLQLLEPLVLKNKDDGFLLELKAQILFESGDIVNAIEIYSKAIRYLDNQESALAKVYFASAILSLQKNDSDLIKLAIKSLREAELFEEENPFLFKQLAVAYNKIKDDGRAMLSLAQFNYLRGNKDKAIEYAKLAKVKLKDFDKEEMLRADDIIELANKMEKVKN